MCHHPPFRQPNDHQYQVLSKHTLNLNHWVDVLHWWHRITLNELTSLQIEKRPSLRSGRQMTKTLLCRGICRISFRAQDGSTLKITYGQWHNFPTGFCRENWFVTLPDLLAPRDTLTLVTIDQIHARPVSPATNITTIVKISTCLLSVDLRLLESRITITTVRIDTIDAHSVRSTCVRAAIVNISAMMDGRENAQWLRSVFQTWSRCRSSYRQLSVRHRAVEVRHV